MVAIPELAGAIERGAPEGEIEQDIRDAFVAIPDEFDVLVLGCTHYPLALPTFRAVLGEKIAIFDPAEAVAERVHRDLWRREAGYGSSKFYISKDSAVFRSYVERLFPGSEIFVEEA